MDDEFEYIQCTRIWQAVILQALADALNNSAKKKNKYIKARADDWLTTNSLDFRKVCAYADIEPRDVQISYQAALAKGMRIHEYVRSVRGTPVPICEDVD